MTEGNIKFTMNDEPTPILELRENGDILVRGNLAANDTEVVNGLKNFLERAKEREKQPPEEKVPPSDITEEENRVVQGLSDRGFHIVAISPEQQGSEYQRMVYNFYSSPTFYAGVQKLLKEVEHG